MIKKEKSLYFSVGSGLKKVNLSIYPWIIKIKFWSLNQRLNWATGMLLELWPMFLFYSMNTVYQVFIIKTSYTIKNSEKLALISAPICTSTYNFRFYDQARNAKKINFVSGNRGVKNLEKKATPTCHVVLKQIKYFFRPKMAQEISYSQPTHNSL